MLRYKVTRATQSKAKDHSPLFHNKEQEQHLLAVFKTLGVARIEVEYSGSGDSGQTDEVRFLDARGRTVRYDEAVKYDFEEEKVNLEGVADRLAWNAVDKGGHGGFYNNEGGFGILVIDLLASPVAFRLDHSDNVIETDESYSMWVAGDPEDAANDLPQASHSGY